MLPEGVKGFTAQLLSMLEGRLFLPVLVTSLYKKDKYFIEKSRCHRYFDMSNKHPLEFYSSTEQKFLFCSMSLEKKRHAGSMETRG